MTKRALIHLGRFAGAIAVFLVVLETMARVDDRLTWNAPWWGAYSNDALNVIVGRLALGRPHGQYEKWRQNAFGFRGPEIQVSKPAGVTRVMLVGASETFGLYESPDMEVSAQLQRVLDAARPGRFQVINTARPGMSPPRVPLYFRSHLRRFDPDLVVFYPTPHFYLDEIPPALTELTPSASTRLDSLRIPGKVRTVFKRVVPPWIQEKMNHLRVERARRRHGPDWVWQTVPRERLDLFTTHLGSIIEEIRAGRARLLLCTHAIRFGQVLSARDRDQLVALEVFYPRATDQAILAIDPLVNERTRRVAARYGVPVVDIDGLLGKSPEYFADFSHFTDVGAARVASILARSILDDARSADLRPGAR
jgi:hypothetical protein